MGNHYLTKKTKYYIVQKFDREKVEHPQNFDESIVGFTGETLRINCSIKLLHYTVLTIVVPLVYVHEDQTDAVSEPVPAVNVETLCLLDVSAVQRQVH